MKSALAKRKIGDAAVAAKTGKTWREWFALLDRAGAKALEHRGIVEIARRHLPGGGDWWGQMVAVAYEQERGLRRPHQRPHGFELSGSKTIAVSTAAAYRAFADARLRRRWLPEAGLTITTATAGKSIRFGWRDGKTRGDVAFYPKGAGKTMVTVQHRRIATAAAADRMKSYWKRQLEKLKAMLEA